MTKRGDPPVIDAEVVETSTALVLPRVEDLRKVKTAPAAAYLLRLAASSRRTQQGALETIVHMLGGADVMTFPWEALAYEHVLAIRAKLAERYAVATANRMLAAVRGVMTECWRIGLVDSDTYRRAVDIPSVKGSRVSKGREIEPEEISALFAVCIADETALGARDAAIIALLRYGGLRREEVVSVMLKNYRTSDGRLTVVGKGNKERMTRIGKNGRVHIDRWLKVRPVSPEDDEGTLITHATLPRRCVKQVVYAVLRRRAEEANLVAESMSPHDFRRTFISNLLDKKVDVSTVQRMVGHASPTTTQRYDRRPDEKIIDAADLLE